MENSFATVADAWEHVFLSFLCLRAQQIVLAKWHSVGRVDADLCACHTLSPCVGKPIVVPTPFVPSTPSPSPSPALALGLLSRRRPPLPPLRRHTTMGARWIALKVAPSILLYPSRAPYQLHRRVPKSRSLCLSSKDVGASPSTSPRPDSRRHAWVEHCRPLFEKQKTPLRSSSTLAPSRHLDSVPLPPVSLESNSFPLFVSQKKDIGLE
jgi:hypothetical protein